MRIAQVAPLFESVPPKLYGGTERVVSYLTEELVGLGHDVTLFASGDSVTGANLVPGCPEALRLNPTREDHLAHTVMMLEEVFRRREDFDIVHFHIDYMHFPLCRRLGIRNVSTLHGRLDFPDLLRLYADFSDMPVVSISDAQRQPLPGVNWQATVYHGLPQYQFEFYPEPGKYLAFLGRISREKGVHLAIQIATLAGIPLKIAAKVGDPERDYFEAKVRPLFDNPLVEFMGEIGYPEKKAFLGNALAVLFPIDWPEPFGLVMIESLACGTPVIAYPRGSVPEVLEDGRTGWLVHTPEAAAQAVAKISQLNRSDCRRSFDERFTSARMANDYLDVYERLTQGVPDVRWSDPWTTQSPRNSI